MYKYYILAFIHGCLLKIYDDLYDNNLYAFFNISKEKSYINEFLKISIIMIGAIFYVNFYMFYVIFVLINITTFFIKPSDYGSFELSGLIVSILLFPFINWKNDSITHYSLIVISILLLGSYFVEKICNCINIEYSYTKLLYRFIGFIFCTLVLSSKYIKNEGIIILLIDLIGFLLTSCIFQYILITYEKEIQQSNLKNKKRKRIK